MQNRYIPDLGDYSKFGVIDALACPARESALRTGVVWYLADPETHGDGSFRNNDGKHRGYLQLEGAKRDRFRNCAPRVYDSLRAINTLEARHVGVYRQRETAGPRDAVCFFEEPLTFANVEGRAARSAFRAAWLGRALRTVQRCELVLLDPDNGLLNRSADPHSRTGPKYATLEECAAFYNGGDRSLVVYQHIHRRGSAAQQMAAALGILREALKARTRPFALRFRRGTARAYLVVPGGAHDELLHARAQEMTAGPWGLNGHFEYVAS